MATTITFNDDQIQTLVVLERVGGSLSLFSVLLILSCYSLFPRLRTVPNTFIVFASIANAGAAIGCIIAYDGIRNGVTSPLCQFQGFLLEMSVQSDPWWSLAMAVNVLLVFVHGANPRTIKKWWWLYCLVCYGGPFGFALACLLVNTPGKSLIYGDAGTWCWIGNEWNSVRIYTCYMLVWVCIMTSLVIYTGVGLHVFRTQNKFRQISGSGSHTLGTFDRRTLHDSTTDRRSAISISDWPVTPSSDRTLFNSAFADLLSGSPSHNRHDSAASSPFLQSSVTRPDRAHSPHRSPNPSFDTSYSRQTATSGGVTPFLISTTPALSPPPSKRASTLERFGIDDPIKRAYLRTAVLFALSVLVTWIPTSIHRVHELIYGDSPFPYNVATAAVLPLQGVWNGAIFFVTSWNTFKECVVDFAITGKREKSQRRGKPARQGKSVYSMWQDAEPAERGVGLGISWRKDSDGSGSNRRDSWDFVDIGVDESQMIGFRGTAQTTKPGHAGRMDNHGQVGQIERLGRTEQGRQTIQERRGRSKEPPKIFIVDCPGGMI